MMYFSRVRIRPDHRSLQSLFTADGYAEHKLLWSLFSAQTSGSRPFLYRSDIERGGTSFLVVSNEAPRADHPVLVVETKDYQPQLKAGERLEFRLRANPVISRRDDSGKLHRHDVVMDAKRRNSGDENLNLMVIVQAAGAEWLAKRSEKHGFEVAASELRVDGYRQHRWFKRTQSRPVRLSTLDFAGVLTVSDPATFTNALINGIGSAKGFGCGLLLVRRLGGC
ncbi:MAG TPA: type I-E CRISPR-associated protein Cas6/Cse3/CasE [Gammaproteobacteria bacterium]|nr:type I-E CRISPR-associated protein Cas6/Cse3/CasE [Gammaproteobacteria bacterium]